MLIPLVEVKNRIVLNNSWWTTGNIPTLYDEMPRRHYFPGFLDQVQKVNLRRSVVLLGPRRVGKTVLVYHAISALINSGVDPTSILHLAIDTPSFTGMNLEQLLFLGIEAAGRNVNQMPQMFVFFDEIQYLKEWESNLKSLTDSFPNIKFIATGSSAAALKTLGLESGAGRFTEYLLPPLTFAEFVDLQDKEELFIETELPTYKAPFYKTNNIEVHNTLWVEYLNFGGYPEVLFNDDIRVNPQQYLHRDIIEKVLQRDLPSLYGVTDVRELNQFFSVLAYQTGEESNLESLSTNSDGIKKDTLNKYLEYLQAAFLIKSVDKVDISAKRLKRRRNFKNYLTSPSLRTALFSAMSSDDDRFGHLNETGIFAQWFHRQDQSVYYAAWNGGEVDVVSRNEATQKPNWAVEIKWSDIFFESPRKLKSLMKFCAQNKLNKAICTTKTTSGIKEIDEFVISYVTSAEYAYTVGKRAIQASKT